MRHRQPTVVNCDGLNITATLQEVGYLPVIRRKALRFFQYFASGKFIKDFDTRMFPMSLFIVATQARLRTLIRELRNARQTHTGKDAALIRRFPFWLATYEDVEITAIDEGSVTRAPFEHRWKMIDSEMRVSPFEV